MAKKNKDEFKEKVEETLSWVAAEFKYMKDLRADLEQLKEDITAAKDHEKSWDKRTWKDMNKALKDYKYVGRAERRIDNLFDQITDVSNEIWTKNGQPNLKQQIGLNPTQDSKLVKRLRLEASNLLYYASLSEGKIKAGLKLFKNYMKSAAYREHAKNQLDLIEAEVDKAITWINSFIIDLKKAEDMAE